MRLPLVGEAVFITDQQIVVDSGGLLMEAPVIGGPKAMVL